MTAELVCAATDPAWKIHRDEPDCDCGRCEPAVMNGPPTLGQILSGNPGCEWPACAIGEGCRWGDSSCLPN